jgi:hypothetical protein
MTMAEKSGRTAGFTKFEACREIRTIRATLIGPRFGSINLSANAGLGGPVTYCSIERRSGKGKNYAR